MSNNGPYTKNKVIVVFFVIIIAISMMTATSFSKTIRIANAQVSTSMSPEKSSSNLGNASANSNTSVISHSAANTKNLTALRILGISGQSTSPGSINFSNLAKSSKLIASAKAPRQKIDIEGEKQKTKSAETAMDLEKSKANQTLVQLARPALRGQPLITSNMQVPGSAAQIQVNHGSIPAISLNITKLNATTTGNSSGTGIINRSSLSVTSLQNPSSMINISPPRFSTINVGLDGLHIGDSGGGFPPDIAVAAGPNHVVEMANTAMQVWTKSGNSVGIVPLRQFFGPVIPSRNDLISDPRVLFDTLSGHWFAVILDGGEGGTCNSSGNPNRCAMLVAVSQTKDPTGRWWTYSFPWGNTLPDQPKIATSNDKLVITADDFNDAFPNGAEEVFVADKTAMVAGSQPSFKSTGILPNEFAMYPAQSLSPTDCLYIVSVGHFGSGNLRLSNICGNPASNNVNFNTNMAFATMMPSTTPLQGIQPSGNPIDTNDGRMLTAAYYNGIIWDGFDDQCIPNGDTSPHPCIRIQQLDVHNPSAPKLTIDTYISDVGTDTYYPSLTVNSAGQMLLVFGLSNKVTDPSLIVGGYNGNTWNFAKLRIGSTTVDDVAFNPVTGENRPRFGDYFGSGVDLDGQSIWVAGEYGNNNDLNSWSSFVARIS